MIIRICAFTEKGRKLAIKIKDCFPEDIVTLREDEDVDVFCEEAFILKCPLIFIGACGIAVRKIAPFIKDKLTDPPVVVLDEMGINVIPVLSGHVGGANELALRIADFLNANAVITTATDVNDTFSVDVFAGKNSLGIANRTGIRKVSGKVLKGENIKISIEGYTPKETTDILIGSDVKAEDNALITLYPKLYCLGIGCKKDTPSEKIEKLIFRILNENDISMENIAGIASIDLKKKERGLIEFAQRHGLPFRTFSADELSMAKGSFTASAFVKEVTGTDNVCERAAVMAAGGGELVIRKQALDGVTAAAAVSKKITLDFGKA